MMKIDALFLIFAMAVLAVLVQSQNVRVLRKKLIVRRKPPVIVRPIESHPENHTEDGNHIYNGNHTEDGNHTYNGNHTENHNETHDDNGTHYENHTEDGADHH
jgi:hypothetical protein